MSDLKIMVTALAIPFALILVGGGFLVWLAPVPAEQMTPAQTHLYHTGDVLVKFSVGAIFALVGFPLALARRRRRAR